MTMTIRFWGVRGSIASPGAATAGVGGNTSCVEVRCGEQRIVLDAGTGLRHLGEAWLGQGEVEASILLSHLHWDHIQGLPFFVPLYLPSTRLTVVGTPPPDRSLRDALARQMQAPNFPVQWGDVPSYVSYREVRPAVGFRLGDVVVRTARLNHPGGATAYRLEHGGRAVVYATDNEHYSCVDPGLVALCEGADVLIYDSQYTPDEYAGRGGPSKVGWGHSTWQAGCALASAAGVGRYVLFHHDPKRTDAQVAHLESLAQAVFPGAVAAREGLEIALPPVASEEAA